MERPKIFTVSELTSAIKQNLESQFTYLSLRGEVSNLRRQASGHTYFTLKDEGSQISAVLFRGSAANLSRLPQEGDQILVQGQLSVYAPRGNYQIIVRTVEFSGEGELLKRLHERKIKLEREGWFDPALKKIPPKLPKTIGVVTSPTGSVIQDILHVLCRRYPGFHLILNPVRVQGAEAAGEIARAIDEFNRYQLADVLIVGRGGGSIEDLWPFNEMSVATAIRKSSIPIISAIGHETDFTIADFVADLRAPTPSAAAELATIEKSEKLRELHKTRVRLYQYISSKVRTHKQVLHATAKHPKLASPYSLLATYMQKLDDKREMWAEGVSQITAGRKLLLNALIREKEALRPSNRIHQQRRQFHRQEADLYRTFSRRIAQQKERLHSLSRSLQSIDPRNLLSKGYSILFDEKNDSVILSHKAIEVGDQLRVKLSDGHVKVEVMEKSQ